MCTIFVRHCMQFASAIEGYWSEINWKKNSFNWMRNIKIFSSEYRKSKTQSFRVIDVETKIWNGHLSLITMNNDCWFGGLFDSILSTVIWEYALWICIFTHSIPAQQIIVENIILGSSWMRHIYDLWWRKNNHQWWNNYHK